MIETHFVATDHLSNHRKKNESVAEQISMVNKEVSDKKL